MRCRAAGLLAMFARVGVLERLLLIMFLVLLDEKQSHGLRRWPRSSPRAARSIMPPPRPADRGEGRETAGGGAGAAAAADVGFC